MGLVEILSRKLSPILAFTILWTLVILKYGNLEHLNGKIVIFLLTPVFLVFAFYIFKEFLRHKEKMAALKSNRSHK